MVSSCGLCVVNTVEEIDGRTTSWRCTVVTLMTMGLNGLKNQRDEKRSVYHALHS
jgi:hypothetical protein